MVQNYEAEKRLIEILMRGWRGEYVDTTEICRKCPAAVPQVCCKYPIPSIPITEEEIAAIAERTKKVPSTFVIESNQKKFLKKPCIFLKGWRCTIHSIKPKQCRGTVCVYGSRYLVKDLPPPQKSVEDAVRETIYSDLSKAGIEIDVSVEALIEKYVKAIKPRKAYFSFLSKIFGRLVR